MAKGEFPDPVQIGARAVAFRESDIAEWINSRPSARGKAWR
jgi:predicted DNA-binding transcriptional regulator AlpA